MSRHPIHLDADVWRTLLDGSLPAGQERRLAEHLAAGDCPRCDAFLDTLDSEREQELLRVLQRVEHVSDLPGDKRQQLLERIAPRPLLARAWLVPAAGLALVLLLALGAVLFFWHDEAGVSSQRVKGEPAGVAVTLSLGRVGTDAAGAKRVERLGRGATVPAGSLLVFRVETQGPCYLYLVVLGSAGAPEVLLPDDPARPLRHAGGVYSPAGDKMPAGVRVAGPTGPRWFAAVCAPRPLELPDDLHGLADRLRAGAGPVPDVVSYDVIDIQVTGRSGQP